MMRSMAWVATRHASRYLTRLSKHWRHEFDIEYTSEQACIPFAIDQFCLLRAVPSGLLVEIKASDRETASTLEQVVSDHLLRMVDQDELSPIRWVAVPCSSRLTSPLGKEIESSMQWLHRSQESV